MLPTSAWQDVDQAGFGRTPFALTPCPLSAIKPFSTAGSLAEPLRGAARRGGRISRRRGGGRPPPGWGPGGGEKPRGGGGRGPPPLLETPPPPPGGGPSPRWPPARGEG